jgi:hypothetical protein
MESSYCMDRTCWILQNHIFHMVCKNNCSVEWVKINKNLLINLQQNRILWKSLCGNHLKILLRTSSQKPRCKLTIHETLIKQAHHHVQGGRWMYGWTQTNKWLSQATLFSIFSSIFNFWTQPSLFACIYSHLFSIKFSISKIINRYKIIE